MQTMDEIEAICLKQRLTGEQKAPDEEAKVTKEARQQTKHLTAECPILDQKNKKLRQIVEASAKGTATR